MVFWLFCFYIFYLPFNFIFYVPRYHSEDCPTLTHDSEVLIVVITDYTDCSHHQLHWIEFLQFNLLLSNFCFKKWGFLFFFIIYILFMVNFSIIYQSDNFYFSIFCLWQVFSLYISVSLVKIFCIISYVCTCIWSCALLFLSPRLRCILMNRIFHTKAF
jgi:hypothetical protein